MKITAKAPFYDRRGLHKKGDVVEIETAAFNPLTMAQVPEVRKKAPEVVKETEEETTDEPVKPVKKTRKARSK